MAHRVDHDRRMVLRDAHVELRVPGVAVVLVGVGRLPVVVAEVRLREGDEHPHVVRRPQDLREAQVRARLAAVVVRVDEVDAEALEPQQALPRRLVVRQRGPDLGIVQRHGGEEDAGAVEVEVPAVDPELAEAEAHGMAGVQHLAPGVQQRELQVVHVLRRMEVPELLGLPLLGEGDAAVLEVAPLERLAGELPDAASVVRDPGTQRVLSVRSQALQRGVERDLPLAHRRVHLHVGDARARRRADQVDVAAQAAPRHRALHLPGRGGVVVREHDPLQRHGHDEHAEHVLAARAGTAAVRSTSPPGNRISPAFLPSTYTAA